LIHIVAMHFIFSDSFVINFDFLLLLLSPKNIFDVGRCVL
jgi:hypothetical protein